MLESLWRRVISVQNSFVHTEARMPFTLFAAMLIPMPVPQQRMPFSHSPPATLCATAAAIGP